MVNNEAVNDETINTSAEDTTVINESDKYSGLTEEEKKVLEEDKIKEQKNKTTSYIDTLKEERDSYREMAEQAIKDKELAIAQREYDVASAQFGEAIVSNDKVKEYKENHPGLSYEECIKLAGVVPEVKPSHVGHIGRPARSSNSNQLSYKIEDLGKMQRSERLEIMRRAKNGEVRIA